MENLPGIGIDLGSMTIGALREMPLAELLIVPFAPLTLKRPLKLFGSALGLVPGVAAVPDPDFIVILLDGAAHQRSLRALVGQQFKNLEHVLRGLHKPSPTTSRQVQAALGLDAAALQALVHGNKTGHLMPQYVAMFQLMEGLFFHLFKLLSSSVVSCAHCNANMLDDTAAWWRDAPVDLAPDAYGFVERLLKAVVGGDVLLGLFNSPSRPAPGVLDQLCSPDIHPIGQWMEQVRRQRKLASLWQLAMLGPMAQAGQDGIGEQRFAKWKSGQDLLPMDTARLMIKGIDHESKLKHGLMAARVFALAVDVVRATAQAAPTRAVAQMVVAQRFAKLKDNLRLSLRAMEKRAHGGQAHPESSAASQ